MDVGNVDRTLLKCFFFALNLNRFIFFPLCDDVCFICVYLNVGACVNDRACVYCVTRIHVL